MACCSSAFPAPHIHASRSQKTTALGLHPRKLGSLSCYLSLSPPNGVSPSPSLVESSGTLRPMLRLALPVLAEQLLHALVMLVDVWLTGRFLRESPELAAIGLMAYTMWFLTSIFDLVATGATALTARFVGAGEARRACQVVNQAIVVGAVVAVVGTLLGFAVARPFVAVMRLEPDAAALAVRYLAFILPILPAIMVQRVGIACLRGSGDMISVFWVMSVVNVVNIAVSCSLAIGLGPFPNLGWDGIAIGTAAAHVTGGLLVLLLLVRGRNGLTLRPRWMRWDGELIGRLLRIGIPGGIDTMSVIACHMWFVAMINDLGNDAAAAHNVAIRLESLGFLPGAAFGMAAMTLAGQFLGARDHDRASRSVLMACLTACSIMLPMGVLFYFGGLPLANFFLDANQTAIALETATLLKIAGLAMLPLALHMVLGGALRGAGDTRWPLVFSLAGFLLIRIPGTYLATQVYDWGVLGAWYAMLADLIVRCLLVSYRFCRGSWKRTKV